MEILLEALAMLRQQGVRVHLRAVGPFESPAYEAETPRCVRRLGLQEHVSWTGFRRDVTAELLKMDLFVLPSLFGEGLPMVVLEAMAAGVPVVATRLAGMPEAVRHGQEGLLAAPGNAADLAHAVARIVRGEMAWASLRTKALARMPAILRPRPWPPAWPRCIANCLAPTNVGLAKCPFAGRSLDLAHGF